MKQASSEERQSWRVVHFDDIPPTSCPCGEARRAFMEAESFPATVHRTEIHEDAALHYHKRLTEAYYILDCGSDAKMQLDEDVISVSPGTCILIPPGVRHRALGRMRVLVLVVPKFDPNDEWMD